MIYLEMWHRLLKVEFLSAIVLCRITIFEQKQLYRILQKFGSLVTIVSKEYYLDLLFTEILVYTFLFFQKYLYKKIKPEIQHKNKIWIEHKSKPPV